MIAPIVMGMVLSAPPAAPAVPLELKGKKGDLLAYQLKVTSEEAPILRGEVKASTSGMEFLGKLRLEILEADATGFRVEGRVPEMKLRVKVGGEWLDGDAFPLLEGVSHQVQRTALTFSLARDGTIGAVELPGMAMSLGKPYYSDVPVDVQRLFQGFLQHAMSVLPKGPVKPGAEWKTLHPSALMTNPPVVFKYQHKYEADEKLGKTAVARVKSKVTVPSTTVGEDPLVFTVGGEGEATTWFAPKEGRVMKSKSVIRSKLELAGPIPSIVLSTVTSLLELLP